MNPLTVPMLLEALEGAAVSSLKFCLIVVPLVAAYEVIKGLPFLRRHGGRLAPLAARLHLAPESLFALSAGLFLGLLYGAGIIIAEAREKGWSSRDLTILVLFLATCHAVIEDTLLFVVLGGSTAWILGPRLVLAAAVSLAAGSVLRRRATL